MLYCRRRGLGCDCACAMLALTVRPSMFCVGMIVVCQPGVPAPATSLCGFSSAYVALTILVAQRFNEWVHSVSAYPPADQILFYAFFAMQPADIPLCACTAMFLVHGPGSSAGDGNRAGHRRCPEGQVIMDMSIRRLLPIYQGKE